jgi:hypothetical protein
LLPAELVAVFSLADCSENDVRIAVGTRPKFAANLIAQDPLASDSSPLHLRLHPAHHLLGNAKSEARNPKQTPNSNIEGPKQRPRCDRCGVLFSGRFGTFGFCVSNLFRISSFGFGCGLAALGSTSTVRVGHRFHTLGVLALAILVALTPSVLDGGLAAERANRDQVRYAISDFDSPF